MVGLGQAVGPIKKTMPCPLSLPHLTTCMWKRTLLRLNNRSPRDEAGQNVVANIQTEDANDGDSPLTFLPLEGPGAGPVHRSTASTGQIKTKTKLNHEDPECNPDGTACFYSVRVKLSDSNGGSAFPLLDDQRHGQGQSRLPKPAAPRVIGHGGLGLEPRSDLERAEQRLALSITGYEIRYRKNGTTLLLAALATMTLGATGPSTGTERKRHDKDDTVRGRCQ